MVNETLNQLKSLGGSLGTATNDLRRSLGNVTSSLRDIPQRVTSTINLKVAGAASITQLSRKLRILSTRSATAHASMSRLNGVMSRTGTIAKVGAAGIGLLVASIGALGFGLLALGRRAHVIDDLATSTTLNTAEAQQLSKAFLGTTSSTGEAQRAAQSLAGTLTDLSDRYFDVTQRAELLRALNVGPQSLGQLGFDIDEVVSGDPRAILEQVRAAVERGVSEQELRIGLRAAGFDQSVITELTQVTRTAEDYQKALENLDAPVLDDDTLDASKRINESINTLITRIGEGLTPVLNAMSGIIDAIGLGIEGFTDRLSEWIPGAIGWFKDLVSENKGLLTTIGAIVSLIGPQLREAWDAAVRTLTDFKERNADVFAFIGRVGEEAFYVVAAVASQVIPTISFLFQSVINLIEVGVLAGRNLVSELKVGFNVIRDVVDSLREKLLSFQITLLSVAEKTLGFLSRLAQSDAAEFLGLGGVGRQLEDLRADAQARIADVSGQRDVIRERREATAQAIAIERQHIADNNARLNEIGRETMEGLQNIVDGAVDFWSSARARGIRTAGRLPTQAELEPIINTQMMQPAPVNQNVTINNENNITTTTTQQETEDALRNNDYASVHTVQEILG